MPIVSNSFNVCWVRGILPGRVSVDLKAQQALNRRLWGVCFASFVDTLRALILETPHELQPGRKDKHRTRLSDFLFETFPRRPVWKPPGMDFVVLGFPLGLRVLRGVCLTCAILGPNWTHMGISLILNHTTHDFIHPKARFNLLVVRSIHPMVERKDCK